MTTLIGTPVDGKVAVGFTLTGLVEGEHMDQVFERLLREIEPKIEVAAGLIGLQRVRFTADFARQPYDEELR